jgi:hypothetical protein
MSSERFEVNIVCNRLVLVFGGFNGSAGWLDVQAPAGFQMFKREGYAARYRA